MLFSELGLSEEILKAVEKIGYEEADFFHRFKDLLQDSQFSQSHTKCPF